MRVIGFTLTLMGLQQSAIAPLADHLSLVAEITNIRYDKGLGTSRFLKSIRAKHETEGTVVLKIFQKPDDSRFPIHAHVMRQQRLRMELMDVPNVLPYQSVQETERAVYLLRQYMANNLYDRISTRPFLTVMEKRWITFQLLSAMKECHSRRIFHGDLKSENILLTSWNWIFVADFANFKPVLLPEDNPSDFSYFFDSSSRRTCYVAPERFESNLNKLVRLPFISSKDFPPLLSKKALNTDQELTAAMDVFSLGCVIAELFLEGSPIFTFPQLLLYRNGEYDPSLALRKIEDDEIRSLIEHMIQLDPHKRFPLSKYLDEWKRIFPEYFESFLYQYMIALSDPQNFSGWQNQGKLNHADYKINRIYHDFDKIAFALSMTQSAAGEKPRKCSVSPLFPLRLSIPNYDVIIPEANAINKVADPIILASLICSCIRNLSLPTLKCRALDILLALGIHSYDELVLDRILPYIALLLEDQSPIVRIKALTNLTQLLIGVQVVTKPDYNIFPEYLLPYASHLSTDKSVAVRVCFAGCITYLAENAQRFLEISQSVVIEDNMNSDPEISQTLEATYDSRLKEIQDTIQEWVLTLLMDQESIVKRALLPGMPQLCAFFGRQKASDIVLSHMITYLNDKDWMLRSAFFESIVGVGAFVGARNLERYIIPLMIQSLYDQEEFVTERALAALRSLVELGLFQRMRIRELVAASIPILLHPNPWLRLNAMQFISSAGKSLREQEVFYLLLPLLKMYLVCEIAELNTDKLIRFTKTPVSRATYLAALRFFQEFRARQEAEASMRKASVIHARNFDQYDFDNYLVDQGIESEEKDKLLSIATFLSKIKTLRHALELDNGPQWRSWEPQEDSLIRILQHINNPSDWVSVQTVNCVPKTMVLSNASAKTSEPKSDYSNRIRIRRASASPQTQSPIYKLRNSPSSPALRSSLRLASRNNELLTVETPKLRTNTSAESISSSTSKGSDVGLVARSVPSTAASDTLATAFIEKALVSSRSPQAENFSKSPEVATFSRINSPVKVAPVVSRFSSLNDENQEFNLMDRLLEKKSHQAFPPAMQDFGRRITGPYRQPMRISGKIYNPPNLQFWHPKGILVSNYKEHTAAVNMVAMPPDHCFFASCSNDGSVKIWDSIRLEKNVTNRSRVTYNNAGSAVRCIAFCEQTYSIAAAHASGIDIFRVDYTSDSVPLPRYGKNHLIHQIDTSEESVQTMDQFNSDITSPLIFATDKNIVYAHDLRTRLNSWQLKVPSKYGMITAMAVDKINHSWLVTGTRKGILSIFDVRFLVPFKSFLHPSQSPIHQLTQTPRHVHPHGNSVMCATGGNEITTWDLQKAECTELICARNLTERVNRYSKTIKALELPQFDPSSLISPTADGSQSLPAMRCFTYPLESSFIITGGEDRKLRFWDLRSVERSRIVSGFKEDLERQYSCSRFDSMLVYHERSVKSSVNNAGGVERSSTSKTPLTQQLSSFTEGGYMHHIDCITSVALTELPYPMVISASRDGVIKVWK